MGGFDSRIGIAGLAVGVIGVAIAILWPDKKWIGWIFLTIGIGVLLLWGVLEVKQRIESRQISLVVSIVLGCILGGVASAAIWSSAHSREPVVSTSNPANGEEAGVQLSITCDNVALPMAYRGDLWILDTVMFSGLSKMMAPPTKEALWPGEGITGFGYICTIKNHGSKPAFDVTVQMTVSVLELIRDGSTWKTGDIRKTREVTVSVPKPLSQQASDQFSFYVCSYDRNGPLTVRLPLVAFINSGDMKNKREVSVKITSPSGNPFSVAPENPFHGDPAQTKPSNLSSGEPPHIVIPLEPHVTPAPVEQPKASPPISSPTEPPPSAYDGLQRVIGELEQLQQRLYDGNHSIKVSISHAKRNAEITKTPASDIANIPAGFANNFYTLSRETQEGYTKLEQKIRNANKAAIEHMNLSPKEVQKDHDVFEAAMSKPHQFDQMIRFTDLAVGSIDTGRYGDLLQYLKQLLDKLGEYPEH